MATIAGIDVGLPGGWQKREKIPERRRREHAPASRRKRAPSPATDTQWHASVDSVPLESPPRPPPSPAQAAPFLEDFSPVVHQLFPQSDSDGQEEQRRGRPGWKVRRKHAAPPLIHAPKRGGPDVGVNPRHYSHVPSFFPSVQLSPRDERRARKQTRLDVLTRKTPQPSLSDPEPSASTLSSPQRSVTRPPAPPPPLPARAAPQRPQRAFRSGWVEVLVHQAEDAMIRPDSEAKPATAPPGAADEGYPFPTAEFDMSLDTLRKILGMEQTHEAEAGGYDRGVPSAATTTAAGGLGPVSSSAAMGPQPSAESSAVSPFISPAPSPTPPALADDKETPHPPSTYLPPDMSRVLRSCYVIRHLLQSEGRESHPLQGVWRGVLRDLLGAVFDGFEPGSDVTRLIPYFVEVNGLRQELQRLKSTTEELTQRVETAQKQLHDERQRSDTLERRMSASIHDSTALSTQSILRSLTDEKQRLVADIGRYKAVIEMNEEDFRALNYQYLATEASLREAEQEKWRMKKQLEGLQKECFGLQTALAASQANLTDRQATASPSPRIKFKDTAEPKHQGPTSITSTRRQPTGHFAKMTSKFMSKGTMNASTFTDNEGTLVSMAALQIASALPHFDESRYLPLTDMYDAGEEGGSGGRTVPQKVSPMDAEALVEGVTQAVGDLAWQAEHQQATARSLRKQLRASLDLTPEWNRDELIVQLSKTFEGTPDHATLTLPSDSRKLVAWGSSPQIPSFLRLFGSQLIQAPQVLTPQELLPVLGEFWMFAHKFPQTHPHFFSTTPVPAPAADQGDQPAEATTAAAGGDAEGPKALPSAAREDLTGGSGVLGREIGGGSNELGQILLAFAASKHEHRDAQISYCFGLFESCARAGTPDSILLFKALKGDIHEDWCHQALIMVRTFTRLLVRTAEHLFAPLPPDPAPLHVASPMIQISQASATDPPKGVRAQQRATAATIGPLLSPVPSEKAESTMSVPAAAGKGRRGSTMFAGAGVGQVKRTSIMMAPPPSSVGKRRPSMAVSTPPEERAVAVLRRGLEVEKDNSLVEGVRRGTMVHGGVEVNKDLGVSFGVLTGLLLSFFPVKERTRMNRLKSIVHRCLEGRQEKRKSDDDVMLRLTDLFEPIEGGLIEEMKVQYIMECLEAYQRCVRYVKEAALQFGNEQRMPANHFRDALLNADSTLPKLAVEILLLRGLGVSVHSVVGPVVNQMSDRLTGDSRRALLARAVTYALRPLENNTLIRVDTFLHNLRVGGLVRPSRQWIGGLTYRQVLDASGFTTHNQAEDTFKEILNLKEDFDWTDGKSWDQPILEDICAFPEPTHPRRGSIVNGAAASSAAGSSSASPRSSSQHEPPTPQAGMELFKVTGAKLGLDNWKAIAVSPRESMAAGGGAGQQSGVVMSDEVVSLRQQHGVPEWWRWTIPEELFLEYGYHVWRDIDAWAKRQQVVVTRQVEGRAAVSPPEWFADD
ncbi:unnamed protein product [Vitrella brassicaformis CCMP3155]|uniref:Uncharacterized protein n=3 Tax=Vitrella brassicaformis TaxID=1169539 RepID=A0A0G4EZB5_VITBC|nr:unnamed protein product [Vitrella brassicaformis CCMP3155]|eukprot:CEM04122.1 unnamed protein product [Vitrella brassicaformis CCMP3155]